MKIEAETVRHVARLAELAVAEHDVDLLATQLESIVEFVEQLDAVECDASAPPVTLGPERVTLRDDVIAPIPMTQTAADLAPAFQQGFFVVPKLGGMSEE
jgi:aspartyl-tRNA(Asn)/glutamyl-tRNA(Gln) amidotransferase subunit C